MHGSQYVTNQLCGSQYATQSPTKLNAAEKNLTQVICLRMGETFKAKTPPVEFKIITPENPLLPKQAVTSKGIPVPYTNL